MPEDYEFVSSERYPIVYSPMEGHVKRVEFKAAILKDISRLKADEKEVQSILFLPKDDAEAALSFASDKAVLAWAYRLIEGQGRQ